MFNYKFTYNSFISYNKINYYYYFYKKNIVINMTDLWQVY